MQRFGIKRALFVGTLGTGLMFVVTIVHVLMHWNYYIHSSQPIKDAELMRVDTFQQYQERFVQVRPTQIPKIIHQIWNEELIPDQFVKNIRSLVKYNPHPEWQYRFYTLDQGRKFVKREFPNLLRIYDASHKYTKPDILRFLLIYHYGGVYFDLDIFGVRPLDRFVEQHECALNGPIPEHAVAYGYKLDPLRVNNAIFLCRPNHPFFELLINRTENFSKSCSNMSCPMPEFPHPLLTYLNEHGPRNAMPEITNRDFFEPIYDLTVTHLLKKKCSYSEYSDLDIEKRHVCDTWRESGRDYKTIPEISYAAHTWFHTGENDVTTLLNLTISDIVPHVQILR